MILLTFFGSVKLSAIQKGRESEIQQFLGCIPPYFWERIEFHMPKTLEIVTEKHSYGLGCTTIDRVTAEINPFPI